ncbi:hypothetical protein [Nocardioides plantarum]|uniref:Uncharacterized protein n=1 Tax=Nocardioides plantarum TaxID=29299 RepID=A0ABV5K7Y5_9ACTN|nr:hypothetical protein [Nocardioides plantarum]
MTVGSRGRSLAAVALAVVLTAAGAVPASAGPVTPAGPAGPAGPAPRAAAASSGTTVRHVVLEWKGAGARSRYTRSFAIPGIGTMTLTCRPDATRVSLKAIARERETQMWLAKYEDKSYGRAVAVKTVRIYRYAHASDDGRGGTANPQHEGLNQRRGKNGVENYAKGYAHGIISQRGGRNVAVGGDPLRAVTTFDLNWYWNGFDYPAKYRSCRFDGTFVTKTTPRIGLNWHGEGDAKGHDYQSVRLPGLGYAQLRCEPGRYGRQTVTLVPDDERAKAYVETVEGEGRVEDQVETRNLVTDRATGRLGPLPLPTNGMMRIFLEVDKVTTPFVMSSYQKLNDAASWRNTCEISMAQFPR